MLTLKDVVAINQELWERCCPTIRKSTAVLGAVFLSSIAVIGTYRSVTMNHPEQTVATAPDPIAREEYLLERLRPTPQPGRFDSGADYAATFKTMDVLYTLREPRLECETGF